MKKTKRKIYRIAMVHPWHHKNVVETLDEIKEMKYEIVGFFPRLEEKEKLKYLCKEAVKRNLKVYVYTGFMKYQEAYLSTHPEQTMVLINTRENNSSTSIMWGCPFNPEFKQRYFSFLKEIAEYPGILAIGVNDEAFLGYDRKIGCYCHVCKADFKKDFGQDMPEVPDWNNPLWTKFLSWRFKRWNDVHGEMKKIINSINPDIRVVFMTSPHCGFAGESSWVTGIELAGMAEKLDGIESDPYYTFHDLALVFHPHEVYLSEWCRFLAGIMPEGKQAEIIVQAFSHPVFRRPLGKEDGYWSAVIPVASGVNWVAPFTYYLQKISPAFETYHRCMGFDRYFSQCTPLKYTGIIHGFNSEVYRFPYPTQGDESYVVSRALACAESLRHMGLPYSYISDNYLDGKIEQYKVAVLPDINFIDNKQMQSIIKYYKNQGNIVVCGEIGFYNSGSNQLDRQILAELCGVEINEEIGEEKSFSLEKNIEVCDDVIKNIQKIIDRKASLCDQEVMMPQFSLKYTRKIKIIEDSQVIARFTDGNPAIVVREKKDGKGNMVYFAGMPSRISSKPQYKTFVRNLSHILFAQLVEWTAGKKPEIYISDWTENIPMEGQRPLDQRFMPSFEFFPLTGEKSAICVISSYFKEPTSFKIFLKKRNTALKSVKELISKKKIEWEQEENRYIINVDIGFDDALKIFVFRFE